MKEVLKRMLENGWSNDEPSKATHVDSAEKKLSVELPTDYKEFMSLSDGGEGELGNIYVSIWKLQDLVRLNEDYQIGHYLGKKFVGFGTDGGDECWAFDFRKSDKSPDIIRVPLGDLELSTVVIVAKNFTEFLKNALAGKIEIQ